MSLPSLLPVEATEPLPSAAPSLGSRIRERRQALGLTLRALAREAGLTPGFISQVERDLASPSLSSLTAIARALQTDAGEFFAQPPTPEMVTRSRERPVYGIDPRRMTYERVSAAFPGNQIRTLLIHESPGLRTEPISHEGEELFYILSGALTVEIEGVRHVLGPGDSVHFDSRRVHSTWNHTQETTTVLHTCTMDVFGETTRAEMGRRGSDQPPTGTQP